MKTKERKKFNDTKFGRFLKDKVKPVAGDVLEVVGDITGIDTIERVGEYLNANKEKNEAFKQLSLEFERYKLEWKLEVMRVETEIFKSEVEDRTSARTREAEFTKATGKRDWLMATVVLTGLFLLVGTIATLVFIEVPQSNQRLADMVFGAVMSIGASIFSYYVGSTKNSRMKDETIYNALNKQE